MAIMPTTWSFKMKNINTIMAQATSKTTTYASSIAETKALAALMDKSLVVSEVENEVVNVTLDDTNYAVPVQSMAAYTIVKLYDGKISDSERHNILTRLVSGFTCYKQADTQGAAKKETVLAGHVITVSEHITNSIKLATDGMDYGQLKAVHEFISTFTGLVSDDTNNAISRHCVEYEANLIKFDGLLADAGFNNLVTVGKLYSVATEYSLKECNQALDKFNFIKVSFDGETLTFTDLK